MKGDESMEIKTGEEDQSGMVGEVQPREVRKVKIRYGQYNSCGVIKYKENRLQGIINVLEKAGYEVELERFEDWNMVEIWARGEKIFACDIRVLDFGSDGYLDRHCAEAVVRVNRAFS